MDTKRILELRGQAARLEATTHVGKGGVTTTLIEEISRQLKDNKLVKVKLLKSAVEETPRKEIAEKLAKETGAELIEIKGNTVVLFRR
ncbi:putative RNA-binding protein containing KH domain, possibly ribosomal protein [Methanocella conradii HZ254]|uniref:RNA-binding protein containing KH domain, possibly ribosomal protein n=1 Tax=Methanocella conradii (strain DSM 24694 / JCM 17849 / CGMCC 1.5162 / HZ254) TaxID=1041930 RepID=H8I9U9_METCZ|nr:YhbY family RNA-binding protein [Methanocella conradii]AFD00909.1 putative RNA-binding protein containing KH domain, possibly ribosomal protein [Methanocella conradii HZ254]